jgi:type III secretion protein Q
MQCQESTMSELHTPFREDHMPAATVLSVQDQQARRVQAASPVNRIGAAHAALTRIAGRGLQAHLPALKATLAVYPVTEEQRTAWPDALTLSGADGAIEIEEGARLLRVLSGIDIAASDIDDANRAWLLSAILAHLKETPFASCDRIERTALPPSTQTEVLRLELRSERHMVSMRMRAAVTTFVALLQQTAWSPIRQSLSSYTSLPIPIDVQLGSHALSVGRLRTLATGDILLPDVASFNVAGEGCISAGRLRIRVRYSAPGTLTVLDVSRSTAVSEGHEKDGSVESTDSRRARANLTKGMEMEERHDENEAQWKEEDNGHDAPDAARENGADDVDAISVPLHFLLGQARINLGDLRTLTAGSIVIFDGGSPQSVAIVSSGRTLGRGEVVDVDGRLGVRISQWGHESE